MYKGGCAHPKIAMVLRAVVDAAPPTKRTDQRPLLMVTIRTNGNDPERRYSKMPEEANPRENVDDETHNPPRRVVYRVTSLPLDAYRSTVIDTRRSKGYTEWWGCCWIGWMRIWI